MENTYLLIVLFAYSNLCERASLLPQVCNDCSRVYPSDSRLHPKSALMSFIALKQGDQ